MNENIELSRLRFAHSHHISMLQLAEAKNGALIAICGTMIALSKTSTFIEVLIILALIISALISLLTFIPQTTKIERTRRSLLFYSDVLSIADNDKDFGAGALNQFDEEAEDYTHQIRELSSITMAKMDKFKLGCLTFVLAVLLFAASILLETICG